ncbi:hypothetical protein ONZ45_g5698 [Pleurotus djamor]|nr:hypothetical protein ONZ45_g19652 [Pleurotus djamor]KAJ8517072.1 hypothetical protein ONZ45_g5698 [Pleurotus djamor]
MLSLSQRQCSRLRTANFPWVRSLTTDAAKPSTASDNAPTRSTTHFKITLRRSAIGLGDSKKGTLEALGIHRRHQTVYHRQTPDIAGKILAVKELLEVENVPEELVKTKEQQTLERRATRGYQIVGSRRGAPMDV